MKEQENIALIEGLFAAFFRGDVPAILGSVTGDTLWSVAGPGSIPYCGEHQGTDGVIAFLTALGTTLDNINLTFTHWAATGDVVINAGRFSATVKATGKGFDAVVAHCFEIRDGKVAKFYDISDTAAIAAAYA